MAADTAILYICMLSHVHYSQIEDQWNCIHMLSHVRYSAARNQWNSIYLSKDNFIFFKKSKY